MSSFIIALVGMTGSGKTTVGRYLGGRLGVPVYDLDREIERLAGKTVRELFDTAGEDAFRRTEHETLSNLLSALHEQNAVFVLSTGGGVVLNPENVALLRREAVTVCLVRSDAAIRRHVRTLARPPINGDFETYRRIAREREPLYRAASEYLICNLDSASSASQILRFLVKRRDADLLRAAMKSRRTGES